MDRKWWLEQANSSLKKGKMMEMVNGRKSKEVDAESSRKGGSRRLWVDKAAISYYCGFSRSEDDEVGMLLKRMKNNIVKI